MDLPDATNTWAVEPYHSDEECTGDGRACAPQVFTSLAEAVFRTRPNTIDNQKRFRACFGMDPNHVAAVYQKIDSSGCLEVHKRASPVHLLWCLYLLKVYPTERLAAAFWGVCENTFHKWAVEIFLPAIGRMDLIIWDRRFIFDIGNRALVTVDGTDFRIQEPGGGGTRRSFDPKFFSHKFNGPALKYEVQAKSCGCMVLLWEAETTAR